MSNPRDFLPLKPVDLQLLLALSEEDRHGYGLVQAIGERTEGLIALEPGNLYRIIKRHLDDGLVAESGRVAIEEGAERRRYYRLTTLGHRVLAAELRRLDQLVRSAQARALVTRWAT